MRTECKSHSATSDGKNPKNPYRTVGDPEQQVEFLCEETWNSQKFMRNCQVSGLQQCGEGLRVCAFESHFVLPNQGSRERSQLKSLQVACKWDQSGSIMVRCLPSG